MPTSGTPDLSRHQELENTYERIQEIHFNGIKARARISLNTIGNILVQIQSTIHYFKPTQKIYLSILKDVVMASYALSKDALSQECPLTGRGRAAS